MSGGGLIAEENNTVRKLLQVLTIVLLVLSGVALTFSFMLFSKRELLKGRVLALEKGVMTLSSLLELPQDPEQKPNAFTEKDVADVTAEPVTDPTRATFWKDYPLHLEDVDKPMATIRRDDLAQYYKTDAISGKPVKNAMGLNETTGEGTLDATLNKVRDAAQYELDRLNETRHRLRAIREELVKTIEELNDGKQRLRQSLGTIAERNTTIAGLEDNVRTLEANVANLEGEKRTLEDQIATQEQKITEQTETIQQQNDTIASQRKKIEDLTVASKSGGDGKSQVMSGLVERTLQAGPKGRVVSVNSDWSYVVLELNEDCLKEIDALREALQKNGSTGIPTVELFLKRGDSFISKVKLVQIKRDQNLAIADVLPDWQQAPVKTGDIAYY